MTSDEIKPTFEEAWRNEEYRKIMAHAARNYRCFLESDELDQLKRLALMDTLRTHDFTNRRKFQTSLHLRTQWRLKTSQRTEMRRKSRLEAAKRKAENSSYKENVEEDVERREFVKDLIGTLDDVEAEVVRLRFYEDMSFREIGGRLEMSNAVVSDVYHRAMTKMQQTVDRKIQKGEYHDG